MNRRKPKLWAFLALGAAIAVGPLVAAGGGEDWPQFRGLERNGISPEKGLAKKWSDSGPKEVWRVPIGEGFSGISVVGDRLYTAMAGDGDDGPKEFAAAFDAKTGKELWRTAIAEKFDDQFGNGPRTTPTVHEDMVFMLSSRGDLVAMKAKDGAVVWQMNLTEKFGTALPRFGFSTSPLVDGGHLVIEAGGNEGKSYVGLDTKTGEIAWSFGGEETRAGYSSPLRVKMGDENRYVFSVGQKFYCIDEEGTEVWAHDWPQGETHAMPVHIPPNKLFHSGAEGVGGHLLEVSVGADGKESVKELWTTNLMRNHFNASVVHGDHIYGFDNATLKAISVADGTMAWGKRGLGKGSVVLADDKLFVLSDQGKLLMLEATPDGYTEKGSVQALEGKCWTAPSISRGKIYLRNHTEMVAYDLKG